MIQAGQPIPAVDVFEGTADGPKPVNTGDLFAGKTTVLFAVPGAYTPTCSAQHLPGFVQHLQAFKDKGVDQVVCMSVNDAFVMAAWGKEGGAEGITMLADGNGAFTEALDLEMDGSAFGMGKRSQRFALVIDNGTVSHVFVEEPGAFEVSSAEHVLSKL